MCTLFKNIYLFICLFIYYVYNILSVCLPAGQKRAPDLIIDGCEPPCGCWELNSGPLEEQSVLLTAEPSLQPLRKFFNSMLGVCLKSSQLSRALWCMSVTLTVGSLWSEGGAGGLETSLHGETLSIKMEKSQAVVMDAFNPSIGRQRQVDLCEFKASLSPE